MSTTNEIAKNTIVVGNGIVTTIPFEFNFIDDDVNVDVVVTTLNTTTLVQTPLVENVDYTLTPSSIVLAVPLPTGTNLLIERSTTALQPLNYEELSPFPAEVTEESMDRIYFAICELREVLTRAALLDKFEDQDLRVILPTPENGGYLAWDGTTGKLKNTSTTIDPLLLQAIDMSYDNTTSTLTASNVQAAIDELDADVSRPFGELVYGNDDGITSSPDLIVQTTGITATLFSRSVTTPATDGVDLRLFAGNASLGLGGDINIKAGNSSSTVGGNVTIAAGTGSVSGTVSVKNLITPVDPKDAIPKDYLELIVDAIHPVGTIITSITSTAPVGRWLNANADQTISRSGIYLELFNACSSLIGALSEDLFGPGDGSTTWDIRSLAALSPRGVGTKTLNTRSKVGPDLGKAQEDQMQRITGRADIDAARTFGNNTGSAAGVMTITDSVNASQRANSVSGGSPIAITFDSLGSPDRRVSATTDGETRGNSFGAYYWIKY